MTKEQLIGKVIKYHDGSVFLVLEFCSSPTAECVKLLVCYDGWAGSGKLESGTVVIKPLAWIEIDEMLYGNNSFCRLKIIG